MLKRFAFIVLSLIAFIAHAESLDRVIALVNDGVITASELNTQLEGLRQQLIARKMELPPDNVLRKQVLQHLIDVDLQMQLAKQHNLAITEQELESGIAKVAENNHLTLQSLQEALEKQGMPWKTYKENIRKEMLLSRLQQKAVAKEVQVTQEQIDDYIKANQDQEKTQYTYHLQNIVIPLPEEPSSEQVVKAKDKIQAILASLKKGEDFSRIAVAESSGEFALEGGDLGEKHLAELPEVFAKAVVNMHVGQVIGPLRTGNGYQLLKLVAVNGDNEKHEIVKTHVRHILLKPDANLTPEEAKRQANNLYQQLRSGKDFALMAKQYSLDSGTAVKGGDLGWVAPSELVPEFEKAMDALPLHQVSKPIKSAFGWHLIEVLERKKMDDTATFKQRQVRQFLQQRKFTEAVQGWNQHLRSMAYIKIMDKDLA